MKKTSVRLFAGACICALSISISPLAIGETVVSSTTAGGTISAFTPGSQIVVRTEDSSAPITYSVGSSVTYVDETGAPVSAEMVKSGLPVTVHYAKEGDRLIANKVVVKKTTTTTTTTTTPEDD